MKFKLIRKDYYSKLSNFDPSNFLLESGRRPHCIILNLKFRDNNYNFAIPFRSNINSNVPKHTYFSLPTRYSTKSHRIHGLHFIKMFPVHNFFLDKISISTDFMNQIRYIEKHKNEVQELAQNYLFNYENGNREMFCLDLDGILNIYFDTLKNHIKIK